MFHVNKNINHLIYLFTYFIYLYLSIPAYNNIIWGNYYVSYTIFSLLLSWGILCNIKPVGAKGDWDFRISDRSKIRWNSYLTHMVNFGDVRRAQFSHIHSLRLHAGVPGIFSNLLRFVQMLKREWGTVNNGKLPHLFIPSKIATLVPKFAVEDLPLDRTAALVPELAVKDLPLGRTLWLYIYIYNI